MKKILALLLSFCLICSVLGGCGKKDEATATDTELLGSWEAWAYGEYVTSWIFNEDLSGTDAFFDQAFSYTAEDGSLIIIYDEEIWGTVEYTYVIDGDTLTMTLVTTDEDIEESSYTYVREGTESSEDESEEESSAEDESAEGDETESETSAE